MNSPPENTPPQTTTQPDCARIAASKQFKDLLAVKRMFIVPAFTFFLLNFIGLAVVVGYAPKLASTRVIGTVNVAYLFGLAEFVLGWTIAGMYLIASAKFDRLTKDILAQIDAPRGGH
jgi:uncharacterized membrane protein (DUF485 family)